MKMNLTTPGCPVSESLPQEAWAVVSTAVDQYRGARVEVVRDPQLSPAMLREVAASAFGLRNR